MEEYETLGQAPQGGIMVVRLDARGYAKTLDRAGVERGEGGFAPAAHAAMVAAARACMEESGVAVEGAYTHSDEVSLLLRPGAAGMGERPMKIVTLLVAEAVHAAGTALGTKCVMDGRASVLPDEGWVGRYFGWRLRQGRANARMRRVEWTLARGGRSRKEARGMGAEAQEALLAASGRPFAEAPHEEREGTALVWEQVARWGRDPRRPNAQPVPVVRRRVGRLAPDGGTDAPQAMARAAAAAVARMQDKELRAWRKRPRAAAGGSDEATREALKAEVGRWAGTADGDARSAIAVEAAALNATLPDGDGRRLNARYAEVLRACGPWRIDTPWDRVGVWSDPHLGHAAVIRYGGRPHADVAAMDEALLAAWREGTQRFDVVVCLGDLTMAHGPGGYAAQAAAMGGRQVLVAGNHDCDRKRARLRVEGFEVVAGAAWGVTMSQEFWLTHVPMQALPQGVVNVHGHTHQRPPATAMHRSACVERTGYRVVALSALVEGRV